MAVYGTPGYLSGKTSFGGGAASGIGKAKKKPKKRPRPANQNAGVGQVKPKPKPKANKQKKYKWPNGSIHTRPYRGHGGGDSNGPAKPAAPPKPKMGPDMLRAQAQADMRYGGAEQSLNQRGQAISPWFQNYMNDVTAAKTQSAQYAAPIVGQAQQRAAQSGQVAPGIDPNSEAGKDAVLAAAARKALGDTLVGTLQGVGLANNNFLSGRQAVAATAEVGEQGRLASERTALKKEKGAYKVDALADLKEKRRQAKLENAAFGLDVAKAQSSAAAAGAQLNKYGYTDKEWASMPDAKRNKIRNKAGASKAAGPDLGKVNKYGYTEKQWRQFPTAKRQNIIKKFDSTGGGKDKAGLTPAQRRDVRKERGKAINRIREIPSLWKEYSKRKKYIDKEAGKTAPLTAADIKTLLRKDGYSQSEINIALRVRSGKPLSSGQRATAKRLGIWPIPKAWKRGKPAAKFTPAPQALGPTDEMRPT